MELQKIEEITYDYYLNDELVIENSRNTVENIDVSENITQCSVKVILKYKYISKISNNVEYNMSEISKFDRYIYIDSENGNDTTGEGSKENPYQTILKAYNDINCDYTAVILKKGTYNLSKSFVQSMCVSSYNNTYWIGDYNNPGEIIVNIASTYNNVYKMKKIHL